MIVLLQSSTTEPVRETGEVDRVRVAVDPQFAATCGGEDRLLGVVAMISRARLPMPLRLSFSLGRGEEYRLHVAHVAAGEHFDGVVVRQFRTDDQVRARARFTRRSRPGLRRAER